MREILNGLAILTSNAWGKFWMALQYLPVMLEGNSEWPCNTYRWCLREILNGLAILTSNAWGKFWMALQYLPVQIAVLWKSITVRFPVLGKCFYLQNLGMFGTEIKWSWQGYRYHLMWTWSQNSAVYIEV